MIPRDNTRQRKSYAAGERATEDATLSRVPRCVAHDGTLVDLFDRAREFRRAIENLVIAEAQCAAGVIPDHDLRTVEAKHDAARAKWLKADERVRRSQS